MKRNSSLKIITFLEDYYNYIESFSNLVYAMVLQMSCLNSTCH